ncbi:MAG: response regulator, partial [Verrucomicrobiaceae bacterium]
FTARLAKQSKSAVYFPEEPAIANTRVLVVDDNPVSRERLHHHITSWRMRCESALNAREALELLRFAALSDTPFDVALLDTQTAGIDGVALVREIKADPLLNNIRIILMTVTGKQLSKEELASEGIAACHTNPIKQSILFDTIHEVMACGTEKQKPKETAPRVSNGSSHRVLLVEDSTVNQRVALGQLKKLGYSADAVANGLEALEAISRIPYDIILMDCQMPEMDGYEATAEIRRRETGGRRPWIIAMTANTMPGDREACLAVGMDDYVSKPTRPEELHKALQKISNMKSAIDSQPAVGAKEIAELLELQAEGENLFGALVDAFTEEAPVSVAGMWKAVEENDTNALGRHAHKLKSSAGHFGATQINTSCVALEVGVRTAVAD